jgi:hypothetical protein
MLQFFYTRRLMEFREGLKRVLLVWQSLTTCRQTPARPWEGCAGAVHCVLNEEKRLAERARFYVPCETWRRGACMQDSRPPSGNRPQGLRVHCIADRRVQ